MDLALPLITPEFWKDCGAQAFDDGLPVTSHNMNPGAPAIKDFEDGWHRRRVERSLASGTHILSAAAPGMRSPIVDSVLAGSVELARAQHPGLSGIEAGQLAGGCPP